ncbi:MAG: hypothetical protein IKK74_00155 [Clostridia bacterium]|nr:hypothetical protein [Clostridia bacterium]
MKFNDKKGIRVITNASAEIDGMDVEYTLLSLGVGFRPVYAIKVQNRDESRISFFGTDKKRAASIFDSVVENTVTPCTLEDIAEDMAK